MFVDHDKLSELFSDFLVGITRAFSEFFCRMFKEIIQKCACTWRMSLTVLQLKCKVRSPMTGMYIFLVINLDARITFTCMVPACPRSDSFLRSFSKNCHCGLEHVVWFPPRGSRSFYHRSHRYLL